MIDGLIQILFFQGLGELVSKIMLPTLPGPVIGLVLLVFWLMLRGDVNASLANVADTFSRYLGLLFVPAAVGVVLYLPELKTNAFAIGTALVCSVVLTIASSALVLKLITSKSDPDG